MWREGETVAFRYTAEHVAAGGPAVAFTLPVNSAVVRTGRLRVPAFFAGLLPEGESRRHAIQHAFHLSEDDELGLLAVVGADLIGDVQVVPAGTPLPPDPAPVDDWGEVSFAEMWRDVSSMRTRSGLPGVQPKMSARSRSLAGGPAGPVILKFAISGWPSALQNEALFMSGAASAGVRAAAAQVVTDAEGTSALAVERFDRTVATGDRLVRHAQEDASQILGLRPGQKYDPDARTVITALADHCAAPRVARRDLFHQLAYSYVIGNNDQHAKNVSIRCPAGATTWSVTPAYDVLHTWPYEGDHRFVPAVRPDGAHDVVSLKWWLGLAADLGLPDRAARRIISQVTVAADALIERAIGDGGLPPALHRDVRRVLRRRARDLGA